MNKLNTRHLEKGEIDIMGRLVTTHRKNIAPKPHAIYQYWENCSLSHILNRSYLNCLIKDKKGVRINQGCMACGVSANTNLERAHILAKSVEGSDDICNLHMLCKTCHKESENLYGLEYWCWISNKAQIYNHGFFTATEQDTKQYHLPENHPDKKYVFYALDYETEYKFAHKQKQIKNYFKIKEGFFPHHEILYSKLVESGAHSRILNPNYHVSMNKLLEITLYYFSDLTKYDLMNILMIDECAEKLWGKIDEIQFKEEVRLKTIHFQKEIEEMKQ